MCLSWAFIDEKGMEMSVAEFDFSSTYLSLPASLYAHSQPDQVPNPRVVVVNHALANALGLDFSTLSLQDQAQLFSGQCLPTGARPYSQSYAGHQFGSLTILGDGRAHMLGEHMLPNGQRVDVQLKGSGRTGYSRGGDGKAALGPMLREYLIAEAMHHLGVPTTRSLAVVTTGETVLREAFLPGAVLTRVAQSHIRVGTFTFAAGQQDPAVLKALLDYTIARHYPQCADAQNPALALLQHVVDTQVATIVAWMRVGFIHGVMNTDNMALSGETIDYGPCAFMDTYHPDTVFSSIDRHGRYAFANQPVIAQWNCARLAEALLPLIDADAKKAVAQASAVVSQFAALYQCQWQAMMCAKLGLTRHEPSDAQLITDLLFWMRDVQADYTNTFRDLTYDIALQDGLYQRRGFQDWHRRWRTRLADDALSSASSRALMAKTNPVVIARNHQVESALLAANSGDYQPLHKLIAVLGNPYVNQAETLDYQRPPTPDERVDQTFCGT